MTQNLIETVFAKVRAEYPHYPTTKPVTKSTILATLEAIREPTPEIRIAAGRCHRGYLSFTAMIDALRAEIESAE
jgi:hypothetical protein